MFSSTIASSLEIKVTMSDEFIRMEQIAGMDRLQLDDEHPEHNESDAETSPA